MELVFKEFKERVRFYSEGKIFFARINKRRPNGRKRAFVEVNLAHRCNLNLKLSPIRLHRLKGGSTGREYGSLCFEKRFFNLAKATNFYQ